MAERKWTRQRVIDRIRDWHRQGTPASHIWRNDKSLCLASFGIFGSWRAALAAAGLQSERQTWSAERVLAELQSAYPPGTPNRRRRPAESRLTAAAVRYFGSRHKALVAAGIRQERPPRIVHTWTPKQVIEAIQSRRDRGLPLTAVWKDDVALYAVAKRIFGGWRRALEAAGFAQRRALTRQEVIQAIQSRHRQGQLMSGVWKTEPTLFQAAKKRFGNWQLALAAAGLPSKLRQRWSKRAVVEAIRRRHQHGPPLSHVWRDDKPLFRAATNHFGNWQSALRAAGVTFKQRQRWSRERVLEGLRHTYRGQTKFYDVDPSLVGAAHRFFCSLYEALEAAGLEPPAGRWTKRRVVEAIQERYVRGLPIEFVGFKDKALGYAAKRYFGTWHAAVAAAGLQSRAPQPVVTRSWTRAAVLEAIRAQSQPGTSLAPIWKQDTGLYSVAKKHFGTWREAVLAAGLEPAQRRWSRELVIQELLARHERGSALSSVVFQEDCRLAGAALRYFGSWRAALKAAGLTKSDLRPQTRTQEQRTTACRAKT